MSFRLKPLYFEIDGPVCTRSASNFFRNPLNFCTHAMWVKWWYHAKFQPFLSSDCRPFQFQGHLAENKSLNAWKIANEVKKDWKLMMWLWTVHIECKKSLELKYVKKWNPFCNRWVFVRNPVTSKEIIQFVHEVPTIYPVTLSTL